MAKPTRVSKTWTIREDLAKRVEEAADLRVVGQALIVERGLEMVLDNLDKAAIPGAPPGEPAPHPPALEGK